MSDCPDGTTDMRDQKTGAVVGTSLMSVIFILFLAVWYFLDYKGKYVKSKTTTISPLPITEITGTTSLIKKISSIINIQLIIAVMCSGLVIGFNTMIMTPLVNTVFPSQTFAQPILIPGTNSSINPGGFLVAFIGFLISLFLLFIIFKVINHFSSRASQLVSMENMSLFLIFILFLGLLIWNAIVTDDILKQPNCKPVVSHELQFPQTYTQYLKPHKQKPTNSPKMPAFGTFG